MLSSPPIDSSKLKPSPNSSSVFSGSSSGDLSEYPPDISIDTAVQSSLLRSLRHDGHLSQLQVSEYLHISRQMYGRYERGRYPMPAKLWKRLSHHLPVPDFLIVEDSEPCCTESSEEKDLLTAFRQLDAEGRKQVLSLIQFETSWLKKK